MTLFLYSTNFGCAFVDIYMCPATVTQFVHSSIRYHDDASEYLRRDLQNDARPILEAVHHELSDIPDFGILSSSRGSISHVLRDYP
jgi:hypothetical protein